MDKLTNNSINNENFNFNELSNELENILSNYSNDLDNGLDNDSDNDYELRPSNNMFDEIDSESPVNFRRNNSPISSASFTNNVFRSTVTPTAIRCPGNNLFQTSQDLANSNSLFNSFSNLKKIESVKVKSKASSLGKRERDDDSNSTDIEKKAKDNNGQTYFAAATNEINSSNSEIDSNSEADIKPEVKANSVDFKLPTVTLSRNSVLGFKPLEDRSQDKMQER